MHRSTIVIALALAFLAALGVGTASAKVPVTGALVMDGSWDRPVDEDHGGLPAQWSGLQVKPGRRICFALDCAGYAINLVKVPVRQGIRAGRFQVRDGDQTFDVAERAEVQGKVTGRPGSIRWYTWSTYFAPGFPWRQADDDHWLVFTQWAVSKGSAPLSMTVYKGQLVLQVNDQANTRGGLVAVNRPWGTPIQPHLGRWIDFGLFVRWSSSGKRGQAQLWINGERQPMNWPFGGDDPDAHGGVGSYAYTGRTLVPGGGPSYVKQGIVRAAAFSGTTTLVHDDLEVHAARTIPRPPPPVTPAAVPPVPVA